MKSWQFNLCKRIVNCPRPPHTPPLTHTPQPGWPIKKNSPNLVTSDKWWLDKAGLIGETSFPEEAWLQSNLIFIQH